MEYLLHAVDRLAPGVHGWVTMFGQAPAGAIALGMILAMGLAGRLLTPFLLLIPALAAGLAAGLSLVQGTAWHPVLAGLAGIVVTAAAFYAMANLFLVRLAVALAVLPIAVPGLWHLAAGAFDGWWTLAITLAGAIITADLLRRFVNSEDNGLYIWITDLIADLRDD